MLFAATLLTIPAIAMVFTTEVNWTAFDFVVGGVLLVGTGLICEIALRVLKKTSHRVVACAVILAVLFVVWAELAVGIFGTPFAGS
jgi:hypothetical protein